MTTTYDNACAVHGIDRCTICFPGPWPSTSQRATGRDRSTAVVRHRSSERGDPSPAGRRSVRPEGIWTDGPTLRWDSSSGLHGRVIGFRQDAVELRTSGTLWLLQDQPSDPARPFSTHKVHTFADGSVSAYGGVYDLTWTEARAHFDLY